MNYNRIILGQIQNILGQKPILVVYGARQVGKTTLLKTFLKQFSKTLYLQGDDPKDAALVQNKSAQELGELVQGYDVVVIDEAQRIKNIGVILKLIADNIPQIKLIASGSSSFDLANQLSEPLTGRHRKFHLYPLSLKELVDAYGEIYVNKELETLMSFGTYPAVVNAVSREEKALLIRELTSDYLFKDLFLLGDIRNAFAFEKLAQLLALRVGSEVSYAELAKEVGVSRETVYNYVNLLEQGFITFRLTPLYKNKTKEINKAHKIYFYDVGIRNALIGNMDPIELRPDKGAIFENFFVAEKMKERSYARRMTEVHFWRGRQGGEVDFVESVGQTGNMFAYECKWKQSSKIPAAFKSAYAQAHFMSINIENIVSHFAHPNLISPQ